MGTEIDEITQQNEKLHKDLRNLMVQLEDEEVAASKLSESVEIESNQAELFLEARGEGLSFLVFFLN